MKIGTFADWFGVGLLEGIRKSEEVGADGVQVYAWDAMDPRSVTADTIREVRSTAKACHQEITALCGELGGHGLMLRDEHIEKIDYLRKTLDLALALDCHIVTTHLGIIPADEHDEVYQVLLEACCKLAEYAAAQGCVLAIETGPEPVDRLAAFIKKCGPGIGINYDPANLVMVTGDDEVRGVGIAGNMIVHTHAKDGIRNIPTTPEHFYGIFAEGGIDALAKTSYAIETPLGEGQVRFDAWIGALKDISYDGFLTIEREVRQGAEEDIRKAVRFLREKL